MNTDLLYGDLTYHLRGSFFNVYNTLGFGHKEGIYCKALAIEFDKKKLSYTRKQNIDVLYEKQKVGVYRPDFIVEDKVLLEVKALPFMGKDPELQMTYYLKGTNYQLGFLVNFGANKLDIRRKIWSYQR